MTDSSAPSPASGEPAPTPRDTIRCTDCVNGTYKDGDYCLTCLGSGWHAPASVSPAARAEEIGTLLDEYALACGWRGWTVLAEFAERERAARAKVDAAVAGLRSTAERARLLLNHAVYVADKTGSADCRIAVAIASKVEAELRAALAGGPPHVRERETPTCECGWPEADVMHHNPMAHGHHQYRAPTLPPAAEGAGPAMTDERLDAIRKLPIASAYTLAELLAEIDRLRSVRPVEGDDADRELERVADVWLWIEREGASLMPVLGSSGAFVGWSCGHVRVRDRIVRATPYEAVKATRAAL